MTQQMAPTRRNPRLLSQERAAFALKRIREIKSSSGDLPTRYRSEIEGLPALVRSAGAGQALAFLLSRDGKEHEQIYQHLEAWLRQRELVGPGQGLMDALVEMDRARYFQTQEELLAICGWLKLFAQAYLPAGSEQGKGAPS